MSSLAGKQWIEACHFHDLTNPQVLREVARRVESHPEHPLVLFDLDSTLYEVGPRTLEILNEWRNSDHSHAFPDIRGKLSGLLGNHVGYSIADTFKTLGLDVTSEKVLSAMSGVKKFWADRFFTSAYLKFDKPYPGAALFVREVYDLGAEVVYLTGRDEPGMGKGTRDNLIRDGFPWDVQRTHLIMKPRFKLPDLEHKVGAAEYIRKHGTLVASFENEPPNIVGLAGQFPDAMHVFVDTVYSDHPAKPMQGLYRISGFENSIAKN